MATRRSSTRKQTSQATHHQQPHAPKPPCRSYGPGVLISIRTCNKNGKKGAGKVGSIVQFSPDGTHEVLVTYNGTNGKDLAQKLRSFRIHTHPAIPVGAEIKNYGDTFFPAK
jgi:hypothetical protein